MKKIFISILSTFVLLGSCSEDDTGPRDPEPKPRPGTGTLIIKPELKVVDETTPATDRKPNFSGYTVTLDGPDGKETLDFPANGTIEKLSVGTYRIGVNSQKDAFGSPAFDAPVYGGSAEASVTEDQSTEVTVPCTQTNTGVYFVFDPSLEKSRFAAIEPTIASEGDALVFTGADRGRKGYFPTGEITVAFRLDGEELFIDGNASLTMQAEAARLWKMTLKVDPTDGNVLLSAEEASDPENIRTWSVSGVPPTLEGKPVEGSALADYPEEKAAVVTSLIVTGSIPSEEAWRALNKFTGLERLYLYNESGTMPDNLFYDEAARQTTMPKLTFLSARHLTGIGSHALYAANLETFEAPALKSIGLFGLAGCMELTSVSLPEVETLDNYTFSECTGLTSVQMPKLKMLSQGTFDMCLSLKEVDIPEAAEGGSGVFFRCDALETISLPKLVKAGKNFLSHCAKLESADLPELVQGDEAFFSGCTSLTSLENLRMPKLEAVPKYMFYNCANLVSANHANASSIGPMAFQECPLLESVSFSNATRIDKQAFEACAALKTVSLPKAEIIAEKAFYKCTALTTVEVSSLREVGDFAFCLDELLGSIDLSTVETIGNSAFYDTAVTSLDMPALTTCAKEAFRKCALLESVSIPLLTHLSNYLFGDCTALKTVDAPAAETSDGHVFNGCKALESLSFPSMKTVGMNLAANAVSLKEVSLPIAETVGNSAFARTAIASIDLPNATSLGTYVFEKCEKLTSVNVPLATTVGNYCFSMCTGLKNIALPKAETISLGTFNGCTALENVDLPAAANVGKWSFRNCTALTELRFGATGEITFGDLVFAHLPAQDPQTITPACNLKLNRDGTEIGTAAGNQWKGYAWKSIEGYQP